MLNFPKFIGVVRFFILTTILLIVSCAEECLSAQVPALKQIVINGDSIINFKNVSRENIKLLTDGIILPNRMNTILFELEPIEDAGYRFYLEGFDEKWTDLRMSNYREYTNLPAGKYKFYTKINIAGNQSEEVLLINVSRLPKWYFKPPVIAFFLIFIFSTIWFLHSKRNLQLARKLEQTVNARTEALIANMFPKSAINGLMDKGKALRIKYDFVTVMFSDIQGFTMIAEEQNTETLIDELDELFFTFDSVVEKYGIEKIKTIGDAYMCAGGIPEKNMANPTMIVLAGLEMMAYMRKLKDSKTSGKMKLWNIRIGIHTGPVVAGFVGQKKLSYDIWGDTVNTASRMESAGEAGKINISGVTYEFIKDFFDCSYRGKIPVKYKGELDMYFVNGIKSELCSNDGIPNRMFWEKVRTLRTEDMPNEANHDKEQ